MSINNKLQFAVVREDPLIDINIIKKFELSNALLVASGGCTALSLLAAFSDLDVHVFDPNPNQIDHVKEKLALLSDLKIGDFTDQFNIDNCNTHGLNEKGNFESLFRGFRTFITEHVVDRGSLEACLSGDDEELNEILSGVYWPIAFELFFNDRYLEAMFGHEATQHAPKNSYPEYFRTCIERGLKSSNRSNNYFLHHIFLGQYLKHNRCLPLYLSSPLCNRNISFSTGFLVDVKHLGSFDYVMLSNIFDWMDDEEVDNHIQLLKHMMPGSVLVYRQLNNHRDLSSKLKPYFKFHQSLSNELLSQDRSLFYSRLVIAERRP